MSRNHIFIDIGRAVVAVLFSVAACVSASAAEPSAPAHKFSATSRQETEQWQTESRRLLFDLLKMNDLVSLREGSLSAIPFDAKVLSEKKSKGFIRREIELNSTPSRRIRAILTIPTGDAARSPAVVCIHGHGGHRSIVYEESTPYRGFAADLAVHGYVTISTDVGQHQVYEEGHTLMGERLWDVLRCADYLATRDYVDTQRMGCAGLSLGGEMAMWLGAMDPRMRATVSSGFLTSVENLQDGHCPCWDFPGFTENFRFSDIYSLIAPRPILCQVGARERLPGGFPPFLAHHEMGEIQRCYAVFGAGNLARLVVHPAGHIFESEGGRAFLDEFLAGHAGN